MFSFFVLVRNSGRISHCLPPFWLDHASQETEKATTNITNNMSAQTEPIVSSPLFTFVVMPSISVDIHGMHEELLVMRVQGSDTIDQIMQSISARTGVPLFELHLVRMIVGADPDTWSDLASDPDATSEEELDAIPEEQEVDASAPDVWEAFYEVEPLSQRPPGQQAPDAPVPGAAGPHAAGPVAPAPGATTHGAAPDAPAPGAAGPHAEMLIGAEKGARGAGIFQ